MSEIKGDTPILSSGGYCISVSCSKSALIFIVTLTTLLVFT